MGPRITCHTSRNVLTGKMRGRVQSITGKIVLQVEVRYEVYDYIPPYPVKVVPSEVARANATWRTVNTYWRDATQSECMCVFEKV